MASNSKHEIWNIKKMKKVIEPRNKRLEVMKQNKRGKNTKKEKRKSRSCFNLESILLQEW
jgi:hypothetical protein